ncbi:AbrB/MazE/SpoVT family DNA-binding domain-containing protein [Rheinheimera muenzenbergensis]|uniref:AbrB/MazE/SpoVT family DNA-binding domain-containing protein n=1 Tax=Rheinheimera muenzenbergensis TaxID=1193628 RepID=A0ABU8C5U6_9GAMM
MAQVIQIGNSKGIRIPQAIIKQTGLEHKELQFKVVPEGLLITPLQQLRQDWALQVDAALAGQSDSADTDWLDVDLTEAAQADEQQQW